VVIEPGSAASGDATRDASMREGEWFDVAHHRTAVFQTTSIRNTGPNRYEAAGTLTIKNRATPVTLPFALVIAGDRADMTGALTLDRTRLGLGLSSDPNGTEIARNVTVRVRVIAARIR
jgi:cytochrome b561